MNYENNTLSKLLNGINHSLNVVNKAIPVYNQAKPLVKSGIKTYNNLKNNNIIKLFKVQNQIKKDMNNTIPNTNIKANHNTSNPKFFI